MRYYDDIAKVPLSLFVDCYIDNNIDSLVIEGQVPRETLVTAWEHIQEQFAVSIGSSEHRIYLGLLKEVNELAATINQANGLISIMEYAYTKQFGIILNNLLKTRLKWPDNGREEINRLLHRSASMVKALDMRLQIKKAYLAGVEKRLENNKGIKPSRAYFDLLLNLVEEYFSVPVDYNILTGRFCDKLKRMSDHSKNKKHK